MMQSGVTQPVTGGHPGGAVSVTTGHGTGAQVLLAIAVMVSQPGQVHDVVCQTVSAGSPQLQG